MKTSHSSLSCGRQTPVTPAHQTLDWFPLLCYSLGILVALSAFCGHASAAVEAIKIGNPIFEPSEFAFGSAPLSRAATNATEFFQLVGESTTQILGENHVLPEDYHQDNPYLPGEPHEGPYDQEARRAFAAQGLIQTDVLLASEIRGDKFFLALSALVPSENAPLGASPDGPLVPIIPNEIFPIESSAQILRNGSPFGGTTSASDLPSLASQGVVTDENGELRDFHGLNWSHYIFQNSLGSPAGRPDHRLVGDWEIRNELRDVNGNGWDINNSFKVVSRGSRIDGDLSHNGELDMHDLNILTQNVAVDAINLKLDMNDDELVDVADIHHWVTELKSTWIGDANLDGEFNSGDFVNVFEAGKYELDEIARWSEGDWNGDERFDSGDFIVAFQDGGYELGARTSVAAVPEPSGWILLTVGLLGIGCIRKKH